MRRGFVCCLLALACGLAASGCRKSAGPSAPAAGGGVEATLEEVDAFTAELVGKVEAASDASAGVAEAQRLLDARGEGLRAKLRAARQSPGYSGEARRRMLESEVDDISRVAGLRTKYMDRAMSDPEFMRRLDKLAADYEALFKE